MNFFGSSYVSDTTLYALQYLDYFCQREWARLKNHLGISDNVSEGQNIERFHP